MQRQLIGPVAAAFTDEQHRTAHVRDDETVPAAEPRGGIHDHREASNRRRRRAAVESRVIGSPGEGNGGAVLNQAGTGRFPTDASEPITTLVENDRSVAACRSSFFNLSGHWCPGAF
jgi:hypothetical protein